MTETYADMLAPYYAARDDVLKRFNLTMKENAYGKWRAHMTCRTCGASVDYGVDLTFIDPVFVGEAPSKPEWDYTLLDLHTAWHKTMSETVSVSVKREPGYGLYYVLKLANGFLGDSDAVAAWMLEESVMLGGVTPTAAIRDGRADDVVAILQFFGTIPAVPAEKTQ